MKSEDKDKDQKSDQSKRKSSDNHWFLLGLLLCAAGVFLFVSFVSYYFNWEKSPDGSGSIYDAIGNFGFSTARSFVNVFGIGAVVFPLILFLIGFHILRPVKSFIKILFALCGAMILLSISSAYLLYPVESARNGWLGRGVGGSQGLAAVEKLIKIFGGIGAGLLIIILIITYCIFLTPKTVDVLKRFFRLTILFMKSLYIKIKELIKKGLKRRKIDEFAHQNNQSEEADQQEKDKIYAHEDSLGYKTSASKSVDNKKNQKEKTKKEDTPSEEDDFVIIQNKDEEETESDEYADKESYTDAEIPSYSPKPEFETESEIEEIYLPEHMLVGELYDPTRDLSGYQRPPVELLEDYKTAGDKTDIDELNRNKDKIVQILGSYKIGLDKIYATVGPTVTLYEVVPKDGVRIAQIKRLEDDIALRIAALGVRIIAPIPGKGTVGIEVPNEKPDIVSMRTIIKSVKFQESKFELPVALGKTILGEVFAFDLAKMPHLLVAGATGQGKSVGLNAILTSLLYKKHPAELKIVMVDPKKVELAPYNKIERHFLAKLPDAEEPIITDTQKVVYTLKSLCMEMDSRYDLLKIAGVRNIKEYNEKFVNRRLNPQKGHKFLPYILLVIDEFADLIMTAGREVEEPIARLAQLARAIGIHLIIATQRPTTNIITGLIKANFPARIAFRVTSMIDSRTILDTPGANQLIGRGDMLVSTGGNLIRVQCAFVDTPEVDRVTDFIRNQPGYGAAHDLPEYVPEDKDAPKQVDMKNLDEMFEEAAKLIVQSQQGSTSLIQRKLELGYNRAGRIMDQLEAAGIVGPTNGSKPRQVLVSDFNALDEILRRYRG
ncbi:MAG: DNA translocase FtsK [Prevotellaceae bacterium]|jgi:S-DNA-T family DNA segregation ATPase FtsK/SpoIIIE|nr:DNA translocase FtsK [Prevotellaceae bacterium]